MRTWKRKRLRSACGWRVGGVARRCGDRRQNSTERSSWQGPAAGTREHATCSSASSSAESRVVDTFGGAGATGAGNFLLRIALEARGGEDCVHVVDERLPFYVQGSRLGDLVVVDEQRHVSARERVELAEGHVERHLELPHGDGPIAVAVKVAEHVFNADASACGVGAQPVEQLLECGRRWRGDDARAVV